MKLTVNDQRIKMELTSSGYHKLNRFFFFFLNLQLIIRVIKTSYVVQNLTVRRLSALAPWPNSCTCRKLLKLYSIRAESDLSGAFSNRSE